MEISHVLTVPSPTFQTVSEKKDEDKSKNENVDPAVKKSIPSLEEPKSPAKSDSKWNIDDDCILIPTNEDSLHLDCRSARFLESTAKSFSLGDADLEHVKKMKDQEESILRALLLETADVASGLGQVSFFRDNFPVDYAILEFFPFHLKNIYVIIIK